VTKNGMTIASGMDTFIWSSKDNHDRPLKAWESRWCQPPYSRDDWLTVFPHATRRLLDRTGRSAPICCEGA
jgi:hypothetical protein